MAKAHASAHASADASSHVALTHKVPQPDGKKIIKIPDVCVTFTTAQREPLAISPPSAPTPPAAPADAPAAAASTLDDILRDLDPMNNTRTQVESDTSAPHQSLEKPPESPAQSSSDTPQSCCTWQ